tara:strand:- start:708 stop:1286 length:579 start_codon:yes stop_codon:yes gene_type:complete
MKKHFFRRFAAFYILVYLLTLCSQTGYSQSKDTLHEPFEVSVLYDLYLARGVKLSEMGLTFTYKETRFKLWEMKRVSYYETIEIPWAELDQNVIDSLCDYLKAMDCFNNLKSIPRPESMGKTSLYIRINGLCLTGRTMMEHGSYYSLSSSKDEFLPNYKLEVEAINTLVDYINALVPDKYDTIIEPPRQIVN